MVGMTNLGLRFGGDDNASAGEGWLVELSAFPPFAMKLRRMGHPWSGLGWEMQVPPLRCASVGMTNLGLRFGRDDKFGTAVWWG